MNNAYQKNLKIDQADQALVRNIIIEEMDKLLVDGNLDDQTRNKLTLCSQMFHRMLDGVGI